MPARPLPTLLESKHNEAQGQHNPMQASTKIEMNITRESIKEYYDSSGWNNTDTAKWVKSHCNDGYYESLDGTLSVFYFPTIIVIISISEVIIMDRLVYKSAILAGYVASDQDENGHWSKESFIAPDGSF
jgi:hypothetical protein